MRRVLRLIGLVVVLAALVSEGCANKEFFKDFRVSQPNEDMWCASGAVSPYPPYCHPDRW